VGGSGGAAAAVAVAAAAAAVEDWHRRLGVVVVVVVRRAGGCSLQCGARVSAQDTAGNDNDDADRSMAAGKIALPRLAAVGRIKLLFLRRSSCSTEEGLALGLTVVAAQRAVASLLVVEDIRWCILCWLLLLLLLRLSWVAILFGTDNSLSSQFGRQSENNTTAVRACLL
jgi:hypothetical protein